MKSQKGQATVELALSITILIFFVFGIIDFGRIFHTYLTLEHAGREAARLASLGATDRDITIRAQQSAPTLNGDDLKITPTPSESNRKTGTYVTVQLTYPFTFSIPLFNRFLPNPFVLKSKTVMRVE